MSEHKTIQGSSSSPNARGASDRPAFSKIPARIVVFSKDVENITGLSKRASRQLLQKIKDALGKLDHMFITVTEFCLCTGIPEEEVRDFIR